MTVAPTVSSTTAGTATTAVPAVGPAFAGLYVAGDRQREADVMLLHLADNLAAVGRRADAMYTHRVSLADGGAVLACSVEFSTMAALDASWPTLLSAARETNAGLYVDDSRTDGTGDAVDVARRAALAGADHNEGRAVVFPGSRELVGTITVAHLLDRSAIDAVSALANGFVADTDLVQTRDFVRPVIREGRLELLVQPAVGGVLVPFEVPNPTPCCADHA